MLWVKDFDVISGDYVAFTVDYCICYIMVKQKFIKVHSDYSDKAITHSS